MRICKYISVSICVCVLLFGCKYGCFGMVNISWKGALKLFLGSYFVK